MKQKTEGFIMKIEQRFMEEKIAITEFEGLMIEWGQLITECCYNEDAKQTYLNLNKLKITVQWIKQQYCPNKSRRLQEFLQLMAQYLSVELRSLTIYPEFENRTIDIREPYSNVMTWTANKRDLIELICSLNEANCINNGKLSLQKLVELFESVFNVELNSFHSELSKMANRKPLKNSDERAYFLNDLAGRFNEKLLNK